MHLYRHFNIPFLTGLFFFTSMKRRVGLRILFCNGIFCYRYGLERGCGLILKPRGVFSLSVSFSFLKKCMEKLLWRWKPERKQRASSVYIVVSSEATSSRTERNIWDTDGGSLVQFTNKKGREFLRLEGEKDLMIPGMRERFYVEIGDITDKAKNMRFKFLIKVFPFNSLGS